MTNTTYRKKWVYFGLYRKKWVYFGLWFQRDTSPSCITIQKHGSQRHAWQLEPEAERSHPQLQVWSTESKLDMGWIIKTLKTRSQWHPSSRRATTPNHPWIAPSTGDQVFKCMRLRGTTCIQTIPFHSMASTDSWSYHNVNCIQSSFQISPGFKSPNTA